MSAEGDQTGGTDDEIVVVKQKSPGRKTPDVVPSPYSIFTQNHSTSDSRPPVMHGPFRPTFTNPAAKPADDSNFISLTGIPSEKNKRKNLRNVKESVTSGAARTAQQLEQERLNRLNLKRPAALGIERYLPQPTEVIELSDGEEDDEPEVIDVILKNQIKEVDSPRPGPKYSKKDVVHPKAASHQVVKARHEELNRLERQSKKKLKDPESIEKNAQGRLLINHDRPDGDPEVFVADHLTDILRPHQLGGIRFMYDNIVESVQGYDQNPGFGCVLAHSMGLGKTIQVIGFVDLFFKTVNAKHVLIITPVNVIQNWRAEFDKWMPTDDGRGNNLRCFNLFMVGDATKSFDERRNLILKWREKTGVLLMGYDMFRILFQKLEDKTQLPVVSRKVLQPVAPVGDKFSDLARLRMALIDPGADLVICDEGHKIKCLKTGITNALNQVRTRRRIVLTGYPLQNNLLEYYCMVNFVRPNYLGTKGEFSATFDRPIKNGQCLDSTPMDIKRAQIKIEALNKLLKGFVQRRSALLLSKILPENKEFVIVVRKTAIQHELYRTFSHFIKLEMYNKSATSYNPLKAHSIGTKIWNHPDLLYHAFVRKCLEKEKKRTNSTGQQHAGTIGDTAERLRLLRTNQDEYFRLFDSNLISNKEFDDDFDELPLEMTYEWAGPILDKYHPMVVEHSNKMIIAFDIIRNTVALGEKLLLFSSSVVTLNLLEKFLPMQNLNPMFDQFNQPIKWTKNVNYCRFDGSTQACEREKLIDKFNNNPFMYLFFISTKAGSLGINLVSANRVIIMDACWNPCHDAQAVCRVYRYGQRKRTYVYRLIMYNSMENAIFYRQISKHGLQQRVVDEKQCAVNVTQAQLEDLLKYDEALDVVSETHDLKEWNFDDSVLNNVIQKDAELMAEKPFLHESMITETENTLSEEERLEVELLIRQETTGFDNERIVNNRIMGGSINIQTPQMQMMMKELQYHNGAFQGSMNSFRNMEMTELGLNRTQFQIKPAQMAGPSNMHPSNSMPVLNSYLNAPPQMFNGMGQVPNMPSEYPGYSNGPPPIFNGNGFPGAPQMFNGMPQLPQMPMPNGNGYSNPYGPPMFNGFPASPIKHPLEGRSTNGSLYKMNSPSKSKEMVESFSKLTLEDDIELPTTKDNTRVLLRKGEMVQIMKMSGKTYMKRVISGEIMDATGTRFDTRTVSAEVIQID